MALDRAARLRTAVQRDGVACRRCNSERGHTAPAEWLEECGRRGWHPSIGMVSIAAACRRSVERVSDVVGSVASIAVYPVKSLGGRTLPAVEVDATGVRGDRVYAVVDADTGERVTVKTTPELREVVATGDTEADTITLTEVLGRPVRLVRSEAGPQVDAAAVHLVSREAIARAAAGDVPEGCSADDPRANLLLHLAGGPDERSWVGRRLQLGEVVLDVLRTPKHCLGVYAEVRKPGRVAQGDAVHLLD